MEKLNARQAIEERLKKFRNAKHEFDNTSQIYTAFLYWPYM